MGNSAAMPAGKGIELCLSFGNGFTPKPIKIYSMGLRCDENAIATRISHCSRNRIVAVAVPVYAGDNASTVRPLLVVAGHTSSEPGAQTQR